MPPRYTYWTIIVGGQPTAFRSATEEDLMPTLKQLQRKHADAAMKWFARGKLWESPEEASEALRKERHGTDREKRGPGWRPGGTHQDPRDRFKVPRDVKRKRFAARMRRDELSPRDDGDRQRRSEDRPFRPSRDKSFRPSGDRPFRPSGDRPFRPSSDKPSRPSGDKPFRPSGDRPFRPSGDRPFRPSGDRPSRPPGDKPFRPSGDRPFRPSGDKPFRPSGGDRPFRPKGGQGRPPSDKPGARSDRGRGFGGGDQNKSGGRDRSDGGQGKGGRWSGGGGRGGSRGPGNRGGGNRGGGTRGGGGQR